ncbi:MAG: glycosyltransferase family 4 protein [bacterium]|nr:glycosyltransferase family 4 protein [bacterium]
MKVTTSWDDGTAEDMKIALLNDSYPPYGNDSVANMTKVFADEYTKKGHDVIVITTHRKKDNPTIQRRDNVISIPVSYRISLRHWLSLYNPAVAKMMKDILKEEQPDVVHAHNIHTYLTYHSLRIAKRYTKNIILTAHDCMSVHYGRIATEKYLDDNNPKISIFDQWHSSGLQWNPFRNYYIRNTLNKYVNIVVAVSKEQEKALRINGITNTTFIHNGINLQMQQTSSTKDFIQKYSLLNKKIILFAGRLSEDKGANVLLSAFQKIHEHMPDVVLLLVGNKQKWESHIRNSKTGKRILPACRFTDYLSSEEMQAAYSIADVVTTPSVYLEPFLLVNIEAMLASKPVVTTKYGGPSEVVEHNKTGFICDPRDKEAYANHLLDLLTHPDKAKKMGIAGEKRAKTFFSTHCMIEKYMQILKN